MKPDTATIVPFRHVNHVIPGKTTKTEVLERFGSPEDLETKMDETLDDILSEGSRIRDLLYDKVVARHPELKQPAEPKSYELLHYKSAGLHFLVGQPSAKVATAYVEPPFSGKSPNGLFLGMPTAEAVTIINRDYHVDADVSIHNVMLSIAETPSGENRFSVWFEDGMLSRMRID